MAIAIGFLFFYQTYLILNDSSSIDNKKNQHKCEIGKSKNEVNVENNKIPEIKNDNNFSLNEKKNGILDENKDYLNGKEKNKEANDLKENLKDKKIESILELKSCNQKKGKDGFFTNIKNTFKKENLQNLKILLGESLLEWFSPVFTQNDYNNGYNYPNQD